MRANLICIIDHSNPTLLVGGWCGTTPEFIRELVSRLPK